MREGAGEAAAAGAVDAVGVVEGVGVGRQTSFTVIVKPVTGYFNVFVRRCHTEQEVAMAVVVLLEQCGAAVVQEEALGEEYLVDGACEDGVVTYTNIMR